MTLANAAHDSLVKQLRECELHVIKDARFSTYAGNCAVPTDLLGKVISALSEIVPSIETTGYVSPDTIDKARMIVSGHKNGTLRNVTSINEDRLEFAEALLLFVDAQRAPISFAFSTPSAIVAPEAVEEERYTIPTTELVPAGKKDWGRAKVGIDGDHGYALLGENLQEGEAEFSPIEAPTAELSRNKQERAAWGRALRALEARLGSGLLRYEVVQ